MVHTTRQRRGYTFETQLVAEFNKGTWKARRLGGSSSGLPDVGIMNNSESLLYSVEAKSTVYNFCEIPVKQIKRCLEFLELFSIYKKKNVIFAFRFATKKSIRAVDSKVKITRTKPIYYFFIIEEFKKLKDIEAFTCNSKGFVSFKIKNYDPLKEYNFDDYVTMEKVTSIDGLKHYNWSKKSNFDHLFTK
jgi:Holliday junction resolvase